MNKARVYCTRCYCSISEKDRETVRETGDIKSKNTEEADRENMGQTEKDRKTNVNQNV